MQSIEVVACADYARDMSAISQYHPASIGCKRGFLSYSLTDLDTYPSWGFRFGNDFERAEIFECGATGRVASHRKVFEYPPTLKSGGSFGGSDGESAGNKGKRSDAYAETG